MRQSGLHSLWMLAASFCFACMGVCVKLAAEQHSAAEIVFWRSALSLLMIAVVVRWRGVSLKTPVPGWQLVRGFVGFVSLALFFIAIVQLPLATAVTLNYTSPLFLAVFLTLFSGVHLRPALLLALGVGLLGVAAVLRPTIGADQALGGLAAIGSGCMAGLAYFNVRKLGGCGEPDARTVFYFSLISSLCAAVWMAFDEFRPVDLRGGLLLLGMALFATLAQLSMTRAYRKGKTLVSASLAYTTVIFASLFGMLLWGEALASSAWLGVGLIVASGVAATTLSRGSDAAAAGEESASLAAARAGPPALTRPSGRC